MLEETQKALKDAEFERGRLEAENIDLKERLRIVQEAAIPFINFHDFGFGWQRTAFVATDDDTVLVHWENGKMTDTKIRISDFEKLSQSLRTTEVNGLTLSSFALKEKGA